VTYSERAGNGDQLLYCEAHASWRRRTARLPLVRRMRPGEQAAPPPPSSDVRSRDMVGNPVPMELTRFGGHPRLGLQPRG
jgi:hypothetical protein